MKTRRRVTAKTVKQPPQIPYPISIALVLSGCALVFSLIAFLKGGPSSILEAIAKSGFTAAFTLIFVSEIGDKIQRKFQEQQIKLLETGGKHLIAQKSLEQRCLYFEVSCVQN
ncbi:hypothetical protein K1719_005457 [Acacia pycnantha]|nr:hypothetical protein K1719_005457 [Acacia pycnantha]